MQMYALEKRCCAKITVNKNVVFTNLGKRFQLKICDFGLVTHLMSDDQWANHEKKKSPGII